MCFTVLKERAKQLYPVIRLVLKKCYSTKFFVSLVKCLFVSRLKYNTLFLCGFFFLSTDGCHLCMEQSILLSIWMTAYLIYTLDKHRLKAKNMYKNMSKAEIILTHIILFIFSKIILLCLISILYCFLSDEYFKTIIPFISIPIVGILFCYTDIYGSISETTIMHMADPNRNPNISSWLEDEAHDQDPNPHLPVLDLGAFWNKPAAAGVDIDPDPRVFSFEDLWKSNVSYTLINAEASLNQIFIFNEYINQTTKNNQIDTHHLRTRYEHLSLMYKNSTEFERIFSEKMKICHILFSTFANRMMKDHFNDKVDHILKIFPISEGNVPCDMTVHDLRTHVLSSVYHVYMQYLNMKIWAEECSRYTISNHGQNVRFWHLEKTDLEQHNFIKHVYLKWNNNTGHKFVNAKVSPVIDNLRDHLKTIRIRHEKFERLHAQNLEKCGYILRKDTDITDMITRHRKSGHLPIYNPGRIAD